MKNFLGLYRHVHLSHAKSLTGEMFVSMGMNAMSGRDLFAEGGLIAFSEGRIANREKLLRQLKLPEDAPGSLIVNRAYRMWGADYPRRIEGGAITAVIDRAEERLILSADRMGALPVFYAWRGRSAAFASHPDFLLNSGVCGRCVDKTGLRELFFAPGMYTPGRTPFRDIRLLEPGCVLIADNRGTRVKRYALFSDMLEKWRSNENSGLDEVIASVVRLLAPDGAGVLIADDLSEKTARMTGEGEKYTAYLFDSSEIQDADDFSETMGDINLALGMPGAGLSDAALLWQMKQVFEKERCILLGGDLPEASENESPGGFLKPEIAHRLGCDTYFGDRINDAMDRFRFALDEEEEAEKARRAAAAYSFLPSYFMRVSMLSSFAGGEAHSLWQDEKIAAYRILSDGGKEKPRGKEYAPSARLTAQIVSAASDVLNDSANPVYPLLDPTRVYRAIENKDTDKLSKLLGINLWLSQYEAEILPF